MKNKLKKKMLGGLEVVVNGIQALLDRGPEVRVEYLDRIPEPTATVIILGTELEKDGSAGEKVQIVVAESARLDRGKSDLVIKFTPYFRSVENLTIVVLHDTTVLRVRDVKAGNQSIVWSGSPIVFRQEPLTIGMQLSVWLERF